MKNFSNKIISIILILIPYKEVKRNGFMPILLFYTCKTSILGSLMTCPKPQASDNRVKIKKSDFSFSKPTILYKFSLNEHTTW